MVTRLVICLHPQDIINAYFFCSKSRDKTKLLIIKDKNFDNSKLLDQMNFKFVEINSIMYNLRFLKLLREFIDLKKKVFLVSNQIKKVIRSNNLSSLKSIWVSDHSRFSISTKIFCDLIKNDNIKLFSFGSKTIEQKYDNSIFIEFFFHLMHKFIYRNYASSIYCFKNIQSQIIFEKNFFIGRSQLCTEISKSLKTKNLFNDSIKKKFHEIKLLKNKINIVNNFFIIDRFSSIKKLNKYLDLEKFNNQYIHFVKKLLTINDYRVILKTHPRDIKNSYLLDYFNDQTEIELLQSKISLEEYYFNKPIPKYSFGIDSSGLKTMSLYGSKCFCLINLFDFSDNYKSRVIDLLDIGFNISFPNNLNELFESLNFGE